MQPCWPRPFRSKGPSSGGYDAAEPQGAWEPYQDYGHNHWHNSLLWGENLHDVSILGPGRIWGKGLSRGHQHDTERPPDSSKPGVGNKTIALKLCRNVTLRDFQILKGGWFGILATGVDNLTIDNLRIDTNRDGMDIDCCRNVRVSNCTVNSPYDDGICPKSSFALGYARATENVTITNCFVTGNYEIGSVLDGTWKPMPAVIRRPCDGTHQVRHGIEWRLPQHHHLELRLRQLPRLRAGDRRWRDRRRHHFQQHRDAQHHAGADVSASGLADARAEGCCDRHAAPRAALTTS